MSSDRTLPPAASSASTAIRSEVPSWDIHTLVGQGREAIIEHEGQCYRLRITANRKLILTK